MSDFKKYPKIMTLGHEENKDIFADPEDIIVVQEKIDGGNFRFFVTKEGKIVFGSKTRELTEIEDSNIGKCFKRVIDYVRERVEKKNLAQLSNLIFYGEACFKHTINYDWERMPLFLGYDIYNIRLDCFLPYMVVEEIFRQLELDIVPLISHTYVTNLPEINDDIVPESKYALASSEDRRAEGLVLKNYNKQIFAKYVRDKFKEKNAEAFGGNPKYNKVDDTNNADFMFRYCTNARIEKMVFKMISEGGSLGMELMGQLIKKVYEDIIEEEWRDILLSNWKLDFKKLRKLSAPRCRAVLQQMMVNNAR